MKRIVITGFAVLVLFFLLPACGGKGSVGERVTAAEAKAEAVRTITKDNARKILADLMAELNKDLAE